uniref:Peroxisomal membrane protein PEX14 n=1 Tax=Alona affinis TaxID=381656 RepID=A0A9N6WSE7_9CRUS|nr:EOG090X0FQ8 [Alona affinis]
MTELERDPSTAVATTENIPQTLRDDLVSTAVKFLQNPRVSTRPHSEKELFLQRKGLTQAEISAAFEALGINRLSDNGTVGHYSSVQVAQVRGYSNNPAVPRSRWVVIRDILNAAALGAGIVYCLRYLYRRFIASWLFGRKKAKTIEETVDEMNSNITRLVSDVSAAVQNLTVSVASLRANAREKSEIKELKSEVASLKALLLGRRQFPAPPTIVAGPPSIPAWQLGASSQGDHMDMRSGQSGQQLLLNHGDGISLSSSPEIISVDEITVNPLPSAGDSNSGSSGRDPSESSESNSAEMVEMGASGGGSSEDTD